MSERIKFFYYGLWILHPLLQIGIGAFMVRVPPERGPGARMEVRLGDATANPYLAMAAVGGHVTQEGSLSDIVSPRSDDRALACAMPRDPERALEILFRRHYSSLCVYAQRFAMD